mgnify:FL=1
MVEVALEKSREARAKLVRKKSKPRNQSAVSQVRKDARRVNEREMKSIKRLLSQPLPAYFSMLEKHECVSQGVAIVESNKELFEHFSEEYKIAPDFAPIEEIKQEAIDDLQGFTHTGPNMQTKQASSIER